MIDRGELLRKLALNAARYSGLGSLAGRFTGGLGAILMLHRVTPDESKPYGFNRHLAITPNFLDDVLTEMRALGFEFVSLDEVARRLASGCGGRRFVAVTADDGYRDNKVHALPVLEKHDAPITVYVAPALIDGSVDLWWDVLEDIVTQSDHLWLATPKGRLSIDCATTDQKFRANTLIHNFLTTELDEEDQKAAIRDLAVAAGVDFAAPGRDTLMNWDELRRMSAHPLVTIGAHTLSHYNLKRLSDGKALMEMQEGAGRLEIELGERPRHFAYPYGYASAAGPREVALAKDAGFVSAVTTRHGVLRPEHAAHMLALPRISVNGRYQNISHVRTMVNGLTTPLANRGRSVVTV
jgi:peptidoglycan/xylan/chitin deacetylase (PgdA/CDA1 family)